MSKIAHEVASNLLEIKAVTLSPKDPYTWASGIKSPIYCDNRVTMSYPQIRKAIAIGLKNIIEEKYPEVEYIVGTATAGIPQACWIADLMELPMIYVRPEAKQHGRGKQIEGYIPEGTKVVVIEDLISTGGSSIKAIEALKDNKIECLGVVAIFTYELQQATENFANASVTFDTLSNYSTLLEVAQSLNYISEDDLESLNLWKKDPTAYTKQNS